MTIKKLKDVTIITMGQSPNSESYNTEKEGVPFFQGKTDFGKINPTVRMYCNQPSKMANINDILMSVRAPVGDVNISNVNCCIGRGLAALTAKPKQLNYKYLFYVLNMKKEMISDMGTGSTFKAISKGILEEIEIPVHNNIVQEKIVNVLDKAQELIDKRKEQIEACDELIKGLFYNMFGDPIINTKNYEYKTLEEVAENDKNAIKAGPFGSALKKEYYVPSGYKIYGQEQVIRNDLTFGNYYIDEERYKTLENCKIKYGDILISLVGTFGKMSVVPKEYEEGIINPRLMKISVNQKQINPLFFKHLFSTNEMLSYVESFSHGGTMGIINTKIMRQIKIITPPITLQNEFILKTKKIEQQKSLMQQSLTQLENNFNSLMQRAFKGELF